MWAVAITAHNKTLWSSPSHKLYTPCKMNSHHIVFVCHLALFWTYTLPIQFNSIHIHTIHKKAINYNPCGGLLFSRHLHSPRFITITWVWASVGPFGAVPAPRCTNPKYKLLTLFPQQMSIDTQTVLNTSVHIFQWKSVFSFSACLGICFFSFPTLLSRKSIENDGIWMTSLSKTPF